MVQGLQRTRLLLKLSIKGADNPLFSTTTQGTKTLTFFKVPFLEVFISDRSIDEPRPCSIMVHRSSLLITLFTKDVVISRV
jgi:hypothetical protein